MQFSEQWLRAYVNPSLDSDALANALTMAGLEVEENEPAAPPFSNVVVAQVKSVTKHPNADKLNVCEVDAGTGALLQIVCGAPNVAAGLRVPCALEGAVLPGDFKIKKTTMRGVESLGMLCSAKELGLPEDVDGLLILPPDAPVGRSLREVLALDDRKITIKLTPNRGDCLSILGVAREVAAITGAPLQQPSFAPVQSTIDERLPVKVHAPDLCGRFSGRVIRSVNAKAPTPAWMKQRLERSGQRSISALVDISNYVMLELGRPSHVFDLDKVHGGLDVRWGRSGEQVELLNGQTVTVDDWVGVIADANGVEGLAGIMGGNPTAVSLDTTNVYLEAAFWWPNAIQGRARRFNFSTDAAHRFERGTDYSTTVDHIEFITRLILDICGTPQTKVGPIDDHVTQLPERKPVAMRLDRCRKIIGVELSDAEIVAAFKRLGLPLAQEAGRVVVTPPPYRFDLEIEEDLIEEVARLSGFERIPAKPPLAPAVMHSRPEALRSTHQLRKQIAQLGYQELINFSFVEEQWERDFAGNHNPIRVLNPIASQLAVMRTTQIGNLVSVLKYNLNRKAQRVRVFEIGRVFLRDPQVPDGPLQVAGLNQPLRLSGLAYGSAHDEQWGERKRDVDFFDVKGDVEHIVNSNAVRFVAAEHPALHPGRSARVELNGKAIGWIGELHPRWQQRYELPQSAVVFELDVAALLPAPLPTLQDVAKFPAVLRDLALWFSAATPVQAIMDTITALSRRDARLAVLRDVHLFDMYRPADADSSKFAGASANALLNKDKSLAFRLVLQDTHRTLSDADADAAVDAIRQELEAKLGAKLRQ